MPLGEVPNGISETPHGSEDVDAALVSGWLVQPKQAQLSQRRWIPPAL